MDKRDKIRDLITSLNSLSFDDDHSLDAYLVRAKKVIHELFGDYNAYLTCLNYIRFHPISPLTSAEENVRFWARAKKELRDFLYVMLDDPLLAPREREPVKVLAIAKEEGEGSICGSSDTVSEVVRAFKHKVRLDLAFARGIDKFVSHPESFSPGGPRPMEKIRIDLRDFFILENRIDEPSSRCSPFQLADMGFEGVLYLPSRNVSMSNDIVSHLRHSGLPVIEGEPLTPAGASVQEQFLRHAKICTAIVVLNDDHFTYPRAQVDSRRLLGPASSVSFSLGFLVGKLGRKRVIALYTDEEHFKRPTNYFDVVYIAYDQAGSWKRELATYFKELRFSLEEIPERHPVPA